MERRKSARTWHDAEELERMIAGVGAAIDRAVYDLNTGLDIPIASLEYNTIATNYTFQYLEGVRNATESGFSGVMEFPDLERVYQSTHLFPIFANRLMLHLHHSGFLCSRISD